jgi:hypothetical protein
MTGARAARTRRGAALPAFLFLAFAFLFQGFAVQTHIHSPAPVSAAAKNGHKTLPGDPAKCPLCQEFLLSGSFVTPAALPLPVPAVTGFAAVLFPAPPRARLFPSHPWQGRAPPQA